MTPVVFIVGAGFSLAANHQYASSDKRFSKRYPQAIDLGVECFGASWDNQRDVEGAFEAALQAGEREPIAKLVKLIQTADYYLGYPEAQDLHSGYGQLLDRFPTAQFISFNYDSLLEQVLLRRGLWNPHDGFGVAVEVGDSRADRSVAPSKISVLHLHGSVLLYSVEFTWERQRPSDNTLWMKPLKEPIFRFDPDNLGHCFSPFSRTSPGLGYRYPEQRLIVPVPNKSKDLRESYVRVIYDRAIRLLGASGQVIAIGYRFAECDRDSFEPLLREVIRRETPMRIVGPDASSVAARLKKRYVNLRAEPISRTFEDWVRSGFHCP